MSKCTYRSLSVPTGICGLLLVSDSIYRFLLVSEGAYWCLREPTCVWGSLLVSEVVYWNLRVPICVGHQSAPSDTSSHLQTQVGPLRYQ